MLGDGDERHERIAVYWKERGVGPDYSQSFVHVPLESCGWIRESVTRFSR